MPDYIAACGVDRQLYSSACSCWGYPPGSRTINLSPPATTTASKAPPVCYYGIDWAFYPFTATSLPQNLASGDGCYSLFSQAVLDVVRRGPPLYRGFYNKIGGTSAQTAAELVYPIAGPGLSIYGSTPTYSGGSGNWVLMHTGYLHVDEIGTYTFQTTTAPDLVLFWFNQTAVSGWTAFNANVRRAKCQNGGSAVTRFQFTSTAATLGAHIPFRIAVVRGAPLSDNVVWDFTISSPTTAELSAAAPVPNPNNDILRFCYDCTKCGPTAPRFAEWEPVLP